MKAIMISIKPKWVAKILNGEKTIEIRKTMPKCDLPIDVYIYVSKNNGRLYQDFSICKEYFYGKGTKDYQPRLYNGKVVAKFTLNKVEEIERYINLSNANLYCFKTKSMLNDELCEKSCLTTDKLDIYLNGGSGYAIHISNLKIFDKPKELSEFKSYKKNIVNTKINGMVFETELDNSLIKAPQNFCYVEVE